MTRSLPRKLSLPAFTLSRFGALTLAAVAVALAIAIPTHTRAHALPVLLRSSAALGQDNGTLTSNFYLAGTYMPVPPRHLPEPIATQTPQPIQPVLRPYPPLAR